MSTTSLCLVESAYVPAAETPVLTATVTTLIDAVNVFNSSGAAATVALKVYATGGTPGAGNMQAFASIAANQSYQCPELVGQTLNAGDVVSALAGTASALVIRISGRQITTA